MAAPAIIPTYELIRTSLVDGSSDICREIVVLEEIERTVKRINIMFRRNDMDYVMSYRVKNTSK